MSSGIRVVHYLNQFFAGLGAEESAGLPPRWFNGPRGPGALIARSTTPFDVVGTLVAGDDHVAENLEQAIAELVELLRRETSSQPVDVLIAGPAFGAGRYGMACAALCIRVEEELGIPAVAGVSPQNPAVEIYRQKATLVRAGDDVMSMGEDLGRLLHVAERRVAGQPLDAGKDGIITKGLRENYFARLSGAERAVEMLLDRMAGKPVVTEYSMPVFDRVPPAPAVGDTGQCTIALVTSGGIVPRGNPDRIESANASRYGEYSIAGLQQLTSDTHQSVHGGYDPTYANQDPNRVLPLDAARDLERSGRIGRLHPSYFATVGNATSVSSAKRYGALIAAQLVNVGVQAVVFTST